MVATRSSDRRSPGGGESASAISCRCSERMTALASGARVRLLGAGPRSRPDRAVSPLVVVGCPPMLRHRTADVAARQEPICSIDGFQRLG
jgi:hypothetical protein